MSDYKELTATEIAAKVKQARLSAVEIAEEALKFAKTEGKELNAFITLCEAKALKQAEVIDDKVKAGEPVGKLAGVPVAIKDNICYRNYETTTCASHIIESIEHQIKAVGVFDEPLNLFRVADVA